MNKPSLGSLMLAVALSTAWPVATQAQAAASELSALSMLPVAVSVVAPVMILSAGATLTVVAVEASAEGAVWVLQRAADGARMSVRLGAAVVGGVSVGVGTAVLVTAMSTGWLLSAAGHALCFVPNEIGLSLMHNERVTR